MQSIRRACTASQPTTLVKALLWPHSCEASAEQVQEGVAQRVACLQLFKHEALTMPLSILPEACTPMCADSVQLSLVEMSTQHAT